MTDATLPAGMPEHTVWRIAGTHAATLDAVAGGLALLRSMIAREDAELGPIDIVADTFDDTAELARSVRTLVRLLVRELAAGPLDAADAHDRAFALGAITEAVEVARLRVNRARRRTALADAAEIVREMGLEYHDIDCIVTTTNDGADAILAIPVAPPVAHVYLLDRLFERADQFMGSNMALSVERSASAWYFARWSSGSNETDDDTDEETVEYPRTVREQEWSVVSRETVSLAAPVIASFVDDNEMIDDDEEPIELPPRQSLLARSLLRSTVGIFEVIDVDGPVLTVRDLNTSATYRVYEHDPDMAPVVGLLLLGRIIPFDDDLWLRSPGGVVLSPPEDADRETLASTLEKVAEGLPMPIAIEGLISTLVYGAEVPLAILPAPTIKEAQAALVEIGEVLADIGLLGDATDAGSPEAPTEDEIAALDAVGLGLDEVMALWIGALLEQAAMDTRPEKSNRARQKTGKRAKRPHQRRRR